MPIKVLIVDDSSLVRSILEKGLSQDPEISIVGSAADPYEARDMIIKYHPDALTLDIEMPRMDGVAFLKKLMPQYPLPVVMVSKLTTKGARATIDALAAGAVDVVAKPDSELRHGVAEMMTELRFKLRVAARANVRGALVEKMSRGASPYMFSADKTAAARCVIAIGASTGGTEAIARLLTGLPPNLPGIVITQHMPTGFTQPFAERLDGLGPLRVREARDGDLVRPGLALVAPGGMQMRLIGTPGDFRVSCDTSPLVNRHRPSVDVLFNSAARIAKNKTAAALLTGMGSDGAQGLLKIREAGGTTMTQDEATSVVYSMPRSAVNLGASEKSYPIDEMTPALITAAATRIHQKERS